MSRAWRNCDVATSKWPVIGGWRPAPSSEADSPGGIAADPEGDRPAGSPTSPTGRPRAAASAFVATGARLRPGRDRAPGSRPGPRVWRWELGRSAVPLRPNDRRRGRAVPSLLARRLRFRAGWIGPVGGLRTRLGTGGDVSARGGLARLRLAGEARRVGVPVGPAHPPQAVLLAGLVGEVLERRLVRLEPEPGRAAAPSQADGLVGHRRRSSARRRASGVAPDIDHSAGPTMQGRRRGAGRPIGPQPTGGPE